MCITLDKLYCYKRLIPPIIRLGTNVTVTRNFACAEAMYCVGYEEGDVSDSFVPIVDLPIYELGARYLAIILENVGPHDMDVQLRKSVPYSNVEDVEEIQGVEVQTVPAGDYAVLELSRPLRWRLYVKNATAGQATKYRVTALVVV